MVGSEKKFLEFELLDIKEFHKQELTMSKTKKSRRSVNNFKSV